MTCVNFRPEASLRKLISLSSVTMVWLVLGSRLCQQSEPSEDWC